MKTIAIIGGGLQGTEAVYLARKAGMRSLLVDKRQAPASGLCDEFYQYDVSLKEKALIDKLRKADMVLPALENDRALDALVQMAGEHDLKLAFDPEAYKISKSKRLSDRLIRENRIPAPEYFPDCKGPYIVKPSGESGSTGVKRFDTNEEVEDFLNVQENPAEWVAQEYLDGKSYSIEIIGSPGNYRTYSITQIHMDEGYDCKKVTAPCSLLEGGPEQFTQIARRLGTLVNLWGIMDVEVIDDDGVLKVLEIDARIPSQTPAVVYHCSGVNLLEELYDFTMGGSFEKEPENGAGRKTAKGLYNRIDQKIANESEKPLQYCAYEHFRIEPGRVVPGGEHMMTEARPLSYQENLFGADEVLSDFDENVEIWRGIFINTADSLEKLERKRSNMVASLTAYVRNRAVG